MIRMKKGGTQKRWKGQSECTKTIPPIWLSGLLLQRWLGKVCQYDILHLKNNSYEIKAYMLWGCNCNHNKQIEDISLPYVLDGIHKNVTFFFGNWMFPKEFFTIFHKINYFKFDQNSFSSRNVKIPKDKPLMKAKDLTGS